jgi:polyhydroxybutyrate depolymerase
MTGKITISASVPSGRMLVLLLLLFPSCAKAPTEQGVINNPNACGEASPDAECHTLSFGGTERAYLLHVPTNFQAGSGALIIALHGSQGSGLRLSETSGLDAKADKEGFAVAYPYSLVSPGAGFTEWNEFYNHSFGSTAPDDVGFIRQLILALEAQIKPDPRKVFVTGLSNGGMMAHRIGVQLSDLVAAIGVVEGTLVSPGDPATVPPAIAPVSVLIIHGDQDPTVPCCSSPPVASQEDTFDYWAGSSADACTSVDTNQPICDGQGNETSLLEKKATGCRGNTEVRFYRLKGGVHLWYTAPMNVPGTTPYNPDFNSTTGVTTDDILWNFFSSHPKS